ncbi:Hsp20 family protein [Mesorhizobium sp. M3A.F.Ca.ET.174.01.1.1]|uniref:Hsp20 family protein n=1 Tax=unclassified Mesorhizobium TaxID=325217 RepID=UPI000F76007A|nr:MULTISPECIES: Hsp20 family protein [unclassified Mesorhizobium]AZO09574.1 Hsp20 family protein [Mesorhizobium sp. M3A.F.Ca.ET.080.04.2.1]RWE33458.1 MAG: Hsp20 family protein [Mesorhizobium sp.]RWF25605.1 MAG: Hsp20 family protein [Mesorhizobium sp.]TGS71497.1 Hsp20 family protein [Mesorhizobium sp. M3A.F.Ca.ET.201.01.1.1]TGS82356.1 Hsp20 family protein [Mesorhizobium sp. M3A.F.Ca.ET.175.01.1.1]
MRTNLDFSPFYRSSIGFDRIFSMLENASPSQNADNWPPYDIAKLGEDAYRIVLAVAGFSEDELTITHQPNVLVIEGAKTETREVHYLHHGLALRSFARHFELADHVTIVGATLENGLLTIDLRKEIPEEMKPRRIAIDVETGRKATSQRNESAAA